MKTFETIDRIGITAIYIASLLLAIVGFGGMLNLFEIETVNLTGYIALAIGGCGGAAMALYRYVTRFNE